MTNRECWRDGDIFLNIGFHAAAFCLSMTFALTALHRSREAVSAPSLLTETVRYGSYTAHVNIYTPLILQPGHRGPTLSA